MKTKTVEAYKKEANDRKAELVAHLSECQSCRMKFFQGAWSMGDAARPPSEPKEGECPWSVYF